MYEPSRHVTSFCIAGFKYWDGALVLDQLKPGMALDLVAEPDNPHDSNALAIYRGSVKLGFVPRSENELPALLAFYGHADILELCVQQVNPSAATYEQVYVGLYVKDARTA